MKEACTDQPIDVFEAIAPLLRARLIIDELCHFDSEWTQTREHALAGKEWFHIVVRGSCVLEQVGGGLLTINARDVLLLPHGNAHVIRSAKSLAAEGLP